MADLNNNRLVLSMRQLSRAIKLSCRILAHSFVSCEVWKALYVGVRVAFHSELNSASQALFNSTFEEVFGVSNVASEYLKQNFLYFSFRGYSEDQVLRLESENLGLLLAQDRQARRDSPEHDIEFVSCGESECVMNIMNHPVRVRLSEALHSKIRERRIQTEDVSTKIDKNNFLKMRPEEPGHPRGEPVPYIITEKLKSNILDLLKIVSFSEKLPVLLEGPTSTGKTSVVMFLAGLLGQTVYRVNNHKDTDLEEYTGSFRPSVDKGGLKFAYGVLARAMKEGCWLLLDELNLAKSEILEALNR